MLEIKNELQRIILGNGQIGNTDKLKTVQNFLRGNEKIGYGSQRKKFIRKEEENYLLEFASDHNLYYLDEISEKYFVAEGAEQKV